MSDIWGALPFPNTLCTGYINGVHLFQLLNYSMSVATFEGEDTDDGGRLLQLSGMRVTYNLQLTGASRLISIEVLDRLTNQFQPIKRLQTYKFATDSYLCDAYTPYPSLLGSDTLLVQGERPGKIESVLFQEMLSSFLNSTTSIETPYDTRILSQPRLINDTTATEVLNLVESEDSCAPGMFWKDQIQTCLSCPLEFDVSFSKERIEFDVERDQSQADTIVLKNHEQFGVAVVPKKPPSWLKFTSEDIVYSGNDMLTYLDPGESIFLSVEVDPDELKTGTTHLTAGFGVLDGGEYPGCVGSDVSFDITLKVYPDEEKNQLGLIRAVGVTLFAIVALTSVSFAIFVYYYRKQQVVKALQPIFLVTISFGVLVLGSTMIPLSIDDEIASQRGCDMKCKSMPWLLFMGFSISNSALLAKLWRINRVFGASNSFRRVQVTAKDV